MAPGDPGTQKSHASHRPPSTCKQTAEGAAHHLRKKTARSCLHPWPEAHLQMHTVANSCGSLNQALPLQPEAVSIVHVCRKLLGLTQSCRGTESQARCSGPHLGVVKEESAVVAVEDWDGMHQMNSICRKPRVSKLEYRAGLSDAQNPKHCDGCPHPFKCTPV